jgi:histidyl-tRNA synthetase
MSKTSRGVRIRGMRYQAPRGTEDVLPSQSHLWQKLESEFRALAHLYGYKEIRTPTFEDTDLFVRSSGETSDIVSKQMYTFEDKGARLITLKPEGTAPAIRAVIEHSLAVSGSIQRLYYITPIFRYERPQKGRLREAHQVGLELVGSSSPAADAEVIEITVRFYERVGLKNVKVLLNSLGRDECRRRFREAILDQAKDYLSSQSEEVREKTKKNPLRLLDSKDPAVHEALKGLPPVLEFLEEDSKLRFDEIQKLLDEAGIPYRVAPEIVRGLDYYTETVFEVQSDSLGAQSSLCGGGRYDDLIKELGGPSLPSVGVAMGIERALIVMEAEGVLFAESPTDVFIVSAGEEFAKDVQALARQLRGAGISTVYDIDGRSMKSQLRQADKSGARQAVIIGEDEVKGGFYTVRDLSTSEQRQVPMQELIGQIRAGAGQ